MKEAGLIEELAAMQGPNVALRFRALGKVEAVEILASPELRDVLLVVERTGLG